MENLLFRRQFLLSKSTIADIPSTWNQLEMKACDQRWNLYWHQDLEVTEATSNNHRLILLGYILDPCNPGSGNADIMQDLLRNKDLEDVINATHMLNGRFLIFYISDTEFKIINDVAAFRELHYLLDNGQIHCGSTADILHAFIGAETSEDKEVFDFYRSEIYRENIYTWIGYDTIYKNIYKLPSNHQIDLIDHSIKRFWPAQRFERKTIQDVSKQCAEILSGAIKAAIKRKPVHMAVTAGWDSRLILAASREIKDQIFYYVNKLESMGDHHPDILIPQRLAKRLGFKINVLEINERDIDEEFRAVHNRNNFRAHEHHLGVFFHGYKNGFDNTFTVNGILAEGTARKYFCSPVRQSRVTPEVASYVTFFKRNPYAIRKLREWLTDAKPLCKELGIDLFDLYTIEQDAPNWSALSSSEQDILREEMRPFNSRHLVALFWSLNDRERFIYNPDTYRSLIRHMWKEALKEPVNPSVQMTIIKKLGLFRFDCLSFNIMRFIKFQLFRIQTLAAP